MVGLVSFAFCAIVVLACLIGLVALLILFAKSADPKGALIVMFCASIAAAVCSFIPWVAFYTEFYYTYQPSSNATFKHLKMDYACICVLVGWIVASAMAVFVGVWTFTLHKPALSE